MHNEKDSNARAPQWKKLYEAAILEIDPTKLQLRTNEAHGAILDRAEQLLTRPPDSEQQALKEALRNLRVLRKMSEVGNGGQTRMRISRSARPYRGYSQMWSDYLKVLCQAEWLREVKTHHVQSWLEEIAREREISKTTLKHVKNFLSGVFRHDAQQG